MNRPSGRSRRSTLVAIVVAAGAVATSGCIGATDRADFDAEVRARGGGISSVWIADAIDLIAAEVGAGDRSELEVLAVTITPGQRSVTATARRADRPDFVDNVTVIEGDVRGVSPMQDADQLPLDDLAVPVDDLPLDRVEELTDLALAEFGEADGYVRSMRFALISGERRIDVDVESARRTGSVLFDGDGNFLEITR